LRQPRKRRSPARASKLPDRMQLEIRHRRLGRAERGKFEPSDITLPWQCPKLPTHQSEVCSLFILGPGRLPLVTTTQSRHFVEALLLGSCQSIFSRYEKAESVRQENKGRTGELDRHRGGIETARWFREFCGVPIVFVTAHIDKDTLQRIRTVLPGAPVLSKPVCRDSLASAVSLASH
jgi:hypothetical protein